MRRYIDISKELFGCAPYPGDPAPVRYGIKTPESDGYALTAFYACAHNGTHIDAPCHFVAGGGDVCSVALEKCVGKCYVAENRDTAARALANGYIRIICKGFDLAPRDAELFSSRAVLLGMDGASFGENTDSGAVHRILLAKEVVLLENLALDGVDGGEYGLIALPLKLGGSDGSPVRAILVKDEE